MHRTATAALCIGVLFAVAPLPAMAASPLPRDANGVPLLFSADEVQYDEDLGLVVAKGNVELTQKDQILLADIVTYNQRTDTVTASGHISLLQATGDLIFADFIELHDDMRDGFIRNVRMVMSDRSRLAGNTARRTDANRMEIRRGVYSPCDLCRDDPTRAPIWQIRAESITSDKQLQIVEYRDAIMEIDGFPIFYTPYFSHADPSVKRQTGFLEPSFKPVSSNLGYYASLPFFWAIGPDKDATFTPIVTGTGGTFLGTQYRQRFGDGRLVTDGSVTIGSKSQIGIDNPSLPANGLRGHLFTESEFDLTDELRTGVNIQRASDQTYLARYNLPSPANSLNSHLFAENFGANSYANVSGWAFQSLRSGIGDSGLPIALPVADYSWVGQPDALGGRLSVQGNALDLVRIQGTDTRRLSTGATWEAPFSGPLGDRYGLSLSVRTDGYDSDHLPSAFGSGEQSAVVGRVFPQLAFSWRYPWVKRGDGYNQVIEPLAMVVASPYGQNPGTIPNEDSQGFEFDETSLFLPNRFPGIDRVDSGQRIDYGLRTGIYGDGGGSTRLIVGQSHAFERNNSFLPGSGLEHHQSDVVGRITASPGPYLDLVYRFRLDHEDLAVRRHEVLSSFGPNNLRLTLNYLDVAAIPDAPDLQKRKQIGAFVSASLTRYWSVQLTATRDFVQSVESLNTGAALTYRDECIAFVTSLTQSGVRFGDVVPGTTLAFTIVFKNLGQVGSTLASFGGGIGGTPGTTPLGGGFAF